MEQNETPEINTNIYGYLVYDNDDSAKQMVKEMLWLPRGREEWIGTLGLAKANL